MDDNLNELRRQRDRIEEHLKWLNAQIAKAEGPKVSTVTPTAPNNEQDQAGRKETDLNTEEESETASTAEPTSTHEVPTSMPSPRAEAKVAKEPEIDTLIQSYAPVGGGNDIQRAKFGCLLLFIFMIGLFLFLLFGLPYLMD